MFIKIVLVAGRNVYETAGAIKAAIAAFFPAPGDPRATASA
jgi:hypothetical protein